MSGRSTPTGFANSIRTRDEIDFSYERTSWQAAHMDGNGLTDFDLAQIMFRNARKNPDL
jgi:hypothetical protein